MFLYSSPGLGRVYLVAHILLVEKMLPGKMTAEEKVVVVAGVVMVSLVMVVVVVVVVHLPSVIFLPSVMLGMLGRRDREREKDGVRSSPCQPSFIEQKHSYTSSSCLNCLVVKKFERTHSHLILVYIPHCSSVL